MKLTRRGFVGGLTLLVTATAVGVAIPVSHIAVDRAVGPDTTGFIFYMNDLVWPKDQDDWVRDQILAAGGIPARFFDQFTPERALRIVREEMRLAYSGQ